MVDTAKILQIMHSKGLNKRMLCERSNISIVTLRAITEGKDTYISTLASIARGLEVPLCSLFADYEPNSVAIADNGGISAAGNASVVVNGEKEELIKLRAENELLKQLLQERERTINVLSQFAVK